MRLMTALVCALVLAGCTDEGGGDPGEQTYDLYTRTRNPIVLIHGMLGFDEIFGIVQYFHGIPEALEAGGAEVYIVTASQAAPADVRGQQIIPQLEAIVAERGPTRFNLIGHSMGALDARYLAAVRPDLVASVTSIAGPHHGSPAAEKLLAMGPAGPLLFGGAADLIKLLSGSEHPNDAAATLASLSPAGAAAFNASYPAAMAPDCGQGAPVVDGIHYWSWGGVGVLTNPFDLSDPFLTVSSTMITEPNDGLVPRCSTHLGAVIRDDYRMNHMDEVNLLFGMVSLLGPKPDALYRAQANRLQLAGL